MNNNNKLFYFLMFLPLFMVLVLLPFLPDQIPAHYGIDGGVDRWGSKYETFIFPAITVIFGFIMLLITKYASKQEKSRGNNKKIGINLGIMLLLFFNILFFYFLYADFNRVENLSTMPINIQQLSFILLGVIIIILGIMMPKLEMNSMIGLRTSWSMKNEITWKKSQQFGGKSFIIVGLLMIMINLLVHSSISIILSLVILIGSLPFDIYYTYKMAKKYN
ncbi:SdpI family protein [uncultured Thomasclavelia sp.]|uniref:SdpI family protein n=1 Tax=uncultured Thomasclavelia sp. TaxID=3025759 RepID=UPI0025D96F17|nr:SdpI family protein [uncultured Thomasclavelia sp.]